jgi:DNA-binding CsgD family transcriptional regulator/pimeloyl-ACP methyl ester carboxylesterase
MSSQRPPAIRYARTDDGAGIAYFRLGRGPAVVEVPHVQMCHMHKEWQIPLVRAHWQRLARHHTVVRFDNRGSGLSHGGPPDFSLTALVRDLEAVVRAAGLERFALIGMITGSLPAVQYASEHPGRVSHLVLWNGFVRNVDHGEAPRLASLFAIAAKDWELFTESISQAATGWRDSETARAWADILRSSTTQASFLAGLEARRGWNVRSALSAVRAPTLVLLDEYNRLASMDRCRELAAGITNARLHTVQGESGMPSADTLTLIERFIGSAGEPVETWAGASMRPLTARERQILALLASGTSNSDIARQLGISVNTVTRHLTHVYAKIGAENRVQAIRRALERGLIQS